MGHGEENGALYYSYDKIHEIIGAKALEIKERFDPDMMIAIGGGGYVPARILRSFIKTPGGKNVPIQAIGLSLYEEIGSLDGASAVAPEKLGKEVIRTQWLDLSSLGNRPLVGRKILIVDEVDDSRTTLDYAVRELQKDIKDQLDALPADKRASLPETKLAIFVVHDKNGPKLGSVPDNVPYFAGQTIPPVWVHYPWEQKDIASHTLRAKEQGN